MKLIKTKFTVESSCTEHLYMGVDNAKTLGGILKDLGWDRSMVLRSRNPVCDVTPDFTYEEFWYDGVNVHRLVREFMVKFSQFTRK